MDTNNKFIVFLDIDGVVNTKKSGKKWISEQLPWSDKYVHHHIEWDENCTYNLNECFRQIRKLKELFIVLSSDWRYENSEKSNRELFTRYEIQQYESITPFGNTAPETHGVRGLEILWWLKQHAPNNPYLVIDDLSFPIKGHIENKNFVFVNNGWHGGGFNPWHKKHAVEKAKKLLGVE